MEISMGTLAIVSIVGASLFGYTVIVTVVYAFLPAKWDATDRLWAAWLWAVWLAFLPMIVLLPISKVVEFICCAPARLNDWRLTRRDRVRVPRARVHK